MFYFFILSLCVSIQYSCCLHCREIENDAVDWWYMYKPPKNSGRGMESGYKFSFFNLFSNGRWMKSPKPINDKESMLGYTLAPLFNLRYQNYLAVMIYQGRLPSHISAGSSAFGILLADELGGLWITHTVPDLVDLNENAYTFPQQHVAEGHLFTCFSFSLDVMNEISRALRQLSLHVVSMRIPARMETHLPFWSLTNTSRLYVPGPKVINFVTRDETLEGTMVIRIPGDQRCLYKTFARNNSIVLDVYGHGHKKNVCFKDFSLRKIERISLKHPEDGFPLVWYIDNSTDRMGFAVSTAAFWQRQGLMADQYWTCTSNVEHERYDFKGGMIVCVKNYGVWLTFDNFKIKEPNC